MCARMVKILEQIRDELKTTRTELSSRLDRLERRQVETEMRLSNELVSVATAIGDLKKVMVEDRKLRALERKKTA